MNPNKEIKLKNPVTCNHCSAWVDYYCRLGYETERVSIDKARLWHNFTTWEDAIVREIPIEPCPKPKNIKEVIRIGKLINVHRYYDINSPEYKEKHKNDRNMTEEESFHHYVNLDPKR